MCFWFSYIFSRSNIFLVIFLRSFLSSTKHFSISYIFLVIFSESFLSSTIASFLFLMWLIVSVGSNISTIVSKYWICSRIGILVLGGNFLLKSNINYEWKIGTHGFGVATLTLCWHCTELLTSCWQCYDIRTVKSEQNPI